MPISSFINEFAVLAVFDGKTVTVFPKAEGKSKWNVQWISDIQEKFWYFDKDHGYEYREGLLVGMAHNEEFYWKIASESLEWLASAFCQFPDPRVDHEDVLVEIRNPISEEAIHYNINTDTLILYNEIEEKREQMNQIFEERIKPSDGLVKKYYPVLVRPINLDPNWPKTRMRNRHFLKSSVKDQRNLKDFSIEDLEDGGLKQNPMDLLPYYVVIVLFNEKSLTASICEKRDVYLKKVNWINETKFWFLDKDCIYTEGIVAAMNDNKRMLDVRIGLEPSKWIMPENNFDTFPDENVHEKEFKKVFNRRRATMAELALSREEDYHIWNIRLQCEDRYRNFTKRRHLVSSNLNKNCEVNTQNENLGVAQLLTRFATIVLTCDGSILNVQSCKGSDWNPEEIYSITNTKFWYVAKEQPGYREGIVIATCCNEGVLDVRMAFRKSVWIRPDDNFNQFLRVDQAKSAPTRRKPVVFAKPIEREFAKKSAVTHKSDISTEHGEEGDIPELSKQGPIEHRRIKRPRTVKANVESSKKVLKKVQVIAKTREDLEPTTTTASNVKKYAVSRKDINFEDTELVREVETIVFLFNGEFYSVQSYAETELYAEDIHWITDKKFWFLDRQKKLYSEGIVVEKCDKQKVPVLRTALEESAITRVARDFNPFPDLNQKAVTRAQTRRSTTSEASKAAHVDLPKVNKHLLAENPSSSYRRELKSHKVKHSTPKIIRKKQSKLQGKPLNRNRRDPKRGQSRVKRSLKPSINHIETIVSKDSIGSKKLTKHQFLQEFGLINKKTTSSRPKASKKVII